VFITVGRPVQAQSDYLPNPTTELMRVWMRTAIEKGAYLTFIAALGQRNEPARARMIDAGPSPGRGGRGAGAAE
jgi:hypothetical protein